MTTISEVRRQNADKKLAAKINAYWKKRGVYANARLGMVETKFYYRHVTIDGKRTRIAINKPDIVRNVEIVSDLRFGFPS